MKLGGELSLGISLCVPMRPFVPAGGVGKSTEGLRHYSLHSLFPLTGLIMVAVRKGQGTGWLGPQGHIMSSAGHHTILGKSETI